MAEVYPRFNRMKEYLDPDGVRWHRRGDQVLEGKQLERRLRHSEVRVLHHYAGDFAEVPPDARDAFWTHVEACRAASKFADFQGVEFKDNAGRCLLVVDESC